MNYSTVKIEPIADLQTAFNTAYRGLKAQGFRRSYDRKAYQCLYRGPNGTKCAVGQLLPARAVKADQNGYAVHELINYNDTVAELFININPTALVMLQGCHDEGKTPDEMKTRLSGFAFTNGLTIPGE